LSEIDNLDIEDRHYKRKKNDLSLRLDKIYDKIEEMETSLDDAKRRKQSLETNKVPAIIYIRF
jgi:putative recombinase